MPMTSVTLRPGVNTMRTLSQNEAGVSYSNNIRYQSGLIEKMGGWTLYYSTNIGSTIRDLWGWEGLTLNKYLGVGATQSLSVINSNNIADITPQTATTNDPVNFSISSGSSLVKINDAGSSASLTTTIYLNTPISIGNLYLTGAYPVAAALGSSSYQIASSVIASTTITSSGLVPTFSMSSGAATVTLTAANSSQYYTTTLGLYYSFIAPTTVGGITISGPYQIQTTSSAITFSANKAAITSASSIQMNGGNAQIVYYYVQGPGSFLGFGGGPFGNGGYGVGTTAPAGSGTPITATDWSLTNWGETFLAVPFGGPLYVWSANSGNQTASVVPTAPFFNGGCFVSQPQQILVLWGSDQSTGVQDPLLVRWSDALDYTNYLVTATTWAGSFRIPTGSVIKGGLQSAQQGFIWTDIDVYVMQNVGQPLVFGFNRIGSGCGLVGQHAANVLNGNIYWMSFNNFFVCDSEGVHQLNCPIWSSVFQNIDTTNYSKVKCGTNSLFNEATWFFPALNGTGENTLWAKYNIAEGEWDYGTLGRSAWIDVTVLGNPIGADLTGLIWQHEIGYNAGTVALDSTFQTGYWSITEGNDLAFVDWILPDMTFNAYGTPATLATLQITFFSTNYTGDTPVAYGPYTFNSTTEYINTRIRGRFLSMKIEGTDLNSFWRIGRIRYRYAIDGRR
jgi:hypothetical protein